MSKGGYTKYGVVIGMSKTEEQTQERIRRRWLAREQAKDPNFVEPVESNRSDEEIKNEMLTNFSNELKAERKPQNAHLKLHEVIWEITGECQNACDYCGSKSEWNKKTAIDDIYMIASAICNYPPEEIDISGGDPTLVPEKVLKDVYDMLKTAKVKHVKILCNPKSFKRDKCLNDHISDVVKKLEIFDWIGISINNIEEACELRSVAWYTGVNIRHKMTVITNFNCGNLFQFDSIHALVLQLGCNWQIQYTTYDKQDNPLAIYNNKEAMKYLFEKITDANRDEIVVIPADDMNVGTCGAGSSSCGILANGDVVGCLSMRAWENPLNIQGNVLTTPYGLEGVWKTAFARYRFNEFKCCKDFCKNKAYVKTESVKPLFDTTPIAPITYPQPIVVQKQEPMDLSKVYVYGVRVATTMIDSSYVDNPYTGNPKQQLRYGTFIPKPPRKI